MTRTIHAMLLPLLSAGILTFCAPQPAYATAYVSCANVAQDANTLYNLMQDTPIEEGAVLIAKMRKTEYGKVVVDVAVAAAKSGGVKAYIRTWHNTCLKLTT